MQTAARAKALLFSLGLGLYCLAIVPLYFAFNPIDPAGVRAIDGFAVGNVVVFAGESPAPVMLGLVLFPLLIWRGRLGAWTVVGLSALMAIGQVAGALFAVTDRTVGVFDLAPGCTLITCGLAHTFFHLSQIPFFLAIARIVLSLEEFRS